MFTWLNQRAIWQQILALVLLIIIPTTGLLSWFLATDLQSEQREARTKIGILNANLANTIEHDLHRNHTLLEQVALLPEIKALSPTQCPNSIKALGKLQIEYLHFALLDNEGKLVCSFLPPPLPANLIQQERTLRSAPISSQTVDQRFLASRAIYDKQHDTWVSILSYPVYRKQQDGATADGVVMLTLDLVKLSYSLLHDAPQEALIGVVDDKQNVLLRSKQAKEYIGKITPPQIRTAIANKHPDLIAANSLDGKRYLIAFQAVPNSDWTIVAGLPEHMVMAEHQRVVNTFLFVGLPCLLLTFLLAWYVSHSIVTPIIKLAQTASAIAAGDNGIRADCHGSVEITAVARQLNHILDLRDSNEVALSRSDQFNRMILNSIDSEIVVLDQDGAIRTFNHGWQRFAHENGAENGMQLRIGSNYLQASTVPSDSDADATAKQINAGILSVLQRKAATFRCEYPCHTEQSKRWFLLSVTPLEQTQGGVVISHTDISERMLADLALKENQALLNNIINSTPSYIFALDRQHRSTLLNNALAMFFGKNKEQVLGKATHEVFPPEIADVITKVNEHIFRTGEPYFAEEIVVGRDGQQHLVMTSKFPLRDEKGDITGLAGVSTDLTEYNATRKALHEHEVQNQALISAIPDMIFVNRRDGLYLACHVSDNMSPIPATEFLHKKLDDLLPANIAHQCLAGIANAIDSQTLQEVNYELGVDGQQRHYEARIAPLGPDSALSIVRDVTSHKQAECALLASLQEKLGLLNEVHHRVKNNLQIISSLLRLEAARCVADETRTIFTDMQNRILTMALLHESLYRNGAHNSVNLDEYLQQLALQILSSALCNHPKIDLQLDLTSVRVSMDQATPCGLLVNELLTNCITHAFPDGRSGTIRIGLHKLADGKQVCLSIADDGIGFTDAIKHDGKKSLGLQLVADLSRQLRGTLEMKSQQGFTCQIIFPPDMPH